MLGINMGSGLKAALSCLEAAVQFLLHADLLLCAGLHASCIFLLLSTVLRGGCFLPQLIEDEGKHRAIRQIF